MQPFIVTCTEGMPNRNADVLSRRITMDVRIAARSI